MKREKVGEKEIGREKERKDTQREKEIHTGTDFTSCFPNHLWLQRMFEESETPLQLQI